MLISNAVEGSEMLMLAIALLAILSVAGLCAATLVFGYQIAAVEKASTSKPKPNRKRGTIFR